MKSIADLRSVAKARLEDADALYNAKRYDGAYYMCGYALELRLKARMVTTLGWTGFPEVPADLPVNPQHFKLHNLEQLLHLSGRLVKVKGSHFADWSIVVEWTETSRYNRVGTVSRVRAEQMILATRALIRVI